MACVSEDGLLGRSDREEVRQPLPLPLAPSPRRAMRLTQSPRSAMEVNTESSQRVAAGAESSQGDAVDVDGNRHDDLRSADAADRCAASSAGIGCCDCRIANVTL